MVILAQNNFFFLRQNLRKARGSSTFASRKATKRCSRKLKVNAKVAQLVERDLAKVEVAGSNPVFCSKKHHSGAFFLRLVL